MPTVRGAPIDHAGAVRPCEPISDHVGDAVDSYSSNQHPPLGGHRRWPYQACIRKPLPVVLYSLHLAHRPSLSGPVPLPVGEWEWGARVRTCTCSRTGTCACVHSFILFPCLYVKHLVAILHPGRYLKLSCILESNLQ